MYYTMPDSCQIKNLSDVYDKFFQNKSIGYFVDVGAYDGITWSNTWGVAEAGWHGICFEPLAEQWRKCRQNHLETHHMVSCVQKAVGDHIAQAEKLYVTPSIQGGIGELPTTDLATVVAAAEYHGYKEDNYFAVSMTTLDYELTLYDAPVGFELLSIDVEGGELSVLKGFSIKRWKPQLVIIESHTAQAEEALRIHTPQVISHMHLAGYNLVQDDGLNSIFSRGDL